MIMNKDLKKKPIKGAINVFLFIKRFILFVQILAGLFSNVKNERKLSNLCVKTDKH